MGSNQATSESELIDQGIAVLKAALPSSWQTVRFPDERAEPTRADAVLNVGPTNQPARVVVEARKSFTPKDVDAVVGRAQLLSRVGGDVPFLVVAPWLSERSRYLLVAAGLNYIDLAGNIRISSNYPALFIFREPRSEAPKRPQSRLSL